MTDQTPTQPENQQRIRGRFAPGQSGNPAGRPRKENTLISCLRDYVEGVPPGSTDGKTRAQLLAEMLVETALRGDQWAVREVYDRIAGRPTQTVQQTNDDVIRVVYETEERD